MPTTVISVPIWDDYSQSEFTIKFIAQMIEMVTGDWLLCIVDNASPSPVTHEFLSFPEIAKHPRIHIIHNPTNLGYGAAANQGITYGFEQGCTYGIVLNNDIEFLNPNWIEDTFVSHLREHPDWLIGVRYMPDNGLCNFGTGVIPYLEGYALGFQRDLFYTLQGFDTRFVAYFEDTDFCYRAVKAGYKLVQSPDFEWRAAWGLTSGEQIRGSFNHIGGRTGYQSHDRFDYKQVTIDSARYFQKKWHLPRLPLAEWENN